MLKKAAAQVAKYIRGTDWVVWLICLGLSGLSMVLLYGIVSEEIIAGLTMRTVQVQGLAVALGATAAAVASMLDYHTMAKLWKLHAPAAYGLVLLTFVLGVGTAERMGDKSWFALPGGLSFQPSELLKISFILTLAYHLRALREEVNRPAHIALLCLHGAVPVLLIHFQGDDGSALIFAFIFIAMLFAAGVGWRYIFPALTAAAAIAPVVWFFVLSDYQRQRFMALIDPNANPRGVIYQQYNARIAIGSGQVWGKGIFEAEHTYIPALHTDFIFSFLGESLGYVGSVATVLVILALCLRVLYDGYRAKDLLGQLICVGVFAMLLSQSLVNIGMCLSLLPVIGITLPFLSAGGSSVSITYLGMGLVLSVYQHTEKRIFSD